MEINFNEAIALLDELTRAPGLAGCGADDDDDVRAYCVDPSSRQPDGSYRQVDDDNCDDDGRSHRGGLQRGPVVTNWSCWCGCDRRANRWRLNRRRRCCEA